MGEIHIGEEVAKAQKDIEARLNELEKVTGLSVADLSLARFETTKFMDARRTFARNVSIVLSDDPGSIGGPRWEPL